MENHVDDQCEPSVLETSGPPSQTRCLVSSQPTTYLANDGESYGADRKSSMPVPLCDTRHTLNGLVASRDNTIRRKTGFCTTTLPTNGGQVHFAPHPCSYPRLLIIDFAICPIAAPRLASVSHRRQSAARSFFSFQKRAITDPPGDRQRRDHSRYGGGLT
jgi:hypothetical protein